MPDEDKPHVVHGNGGVMRVSCQEYQEYVEQASWQAENVRLRDEVRKLKLRLREVEDEWSKDREW